MRQAGDSAAGIVGTEHHVQRLEQDHANARLLAQGWPPYLNRDIRLRFRPISSTLVWRRGALGRGV